MMLPFDRVPAGQFNNRNLRRLWINAKICSAHGFGLRSSGFPDAMWAFRNVIQDDVYAFGLRPITVMTADQDMQSINDSRNNCEVFRLCCFLPVWRNFASMNGVAVRPRADAGL
jgi:hypothetical protein